MTSIPPAMDQFERPDPALTNKIVTLLKSQGIFDQFRRECMADVDTKPAYQNLRQRVEGSVAAFLKQNPWRPDMNKNQVRDNLRKHIQSGGFLDIGVDRIVDQVVNPKIYTVFLPKVEEVVHSCLGMDKNKKPTFRPPPPPPERPELPKFKNKHNLVPRARITASLAGPRLPPIPNIEALKPPQPLRTKEEDKLLDPASPDIEEPTDNKYVVDEDDIDDNAEEDDEESPPFEPHSESDRLILGVRTDSSDSNSYDSQVQTSIVDDNLEERIDKNDAESINDSKEGTDYKEVAKKEEESSSDEYVPKTPTINMEGSDGSVIEFNSISEYKQYQTKFDEETLGNVEEVISSHWVDDASQPGKDERSSNEEDSVVGSRKRKLNIDSYDEASSSSVDKGNTSDEGKTSSFNRFIQKKFKIEEVQHEDEYVGELMNDHENEDSNAVKSMDVSEINTKLSDNENREKSKRSSSNSSKDSGKSHRHHHGHKDHKDSSSLHSISSKAMDKEYMGASVSSNNSSKKDLKKEGKHGSSRDGNKDRERKKSESSSSKHSDRDKSKHHDKAKEKVDDKRRLDKLESDRKEKNDTENDKKESKHEHREKPRDHHDKEKKKPDGHDKHSEGKRDHDSSHKHEKDKRESSKNTKHSHTPSKHSHRSSEKHKSDKEHKHRESPSDKHRSHDKKSEKDSKHESRKKQREQCKSSFKDSEGRRSTDRDSNGPSGRNHMPSTSRSSTSRSHTETHIETGEKTTSNSDNTVSDNTEALLDEDSKFGSVSEPGIASPDPELADSSWSELGSDWNGSKEDLRETSYELSTELNQISPFVMDDSRDTVVNIDLVGEDSLISANECSKSDEPERLNTESLEGNLSDFENTDDKTAGRTDDILQNIKENIFVENNTSNEQDFSVSVSSVHDTSSEKENIETAVIRKDSNKCASETGSNVDNKEVKFKKPKIAANIFEVKKIMQARRHLKRMEKKRMKLLMKSNTDECSVQKVSIAENNAEKVEEEFTGFVASTSNKIEKYGCLIDRLNNEVETAVTNEEGNPNLITSLIEVNPNLDEYIETVLKGKVHRKTRVRLPPICDKYYRFDPEQNAYILIRDREESPIPNEELVDDNLNNLNSALKAQEIHSGIKHAQHGITNNTFNGTKSETKQNVPTESILSTYEVDKTVTPPEKDGDDKIYNPPVNKISHKLPEITKVKTKNLQKDVKPSKVSSEMYCEVGSKPNSDVQPKPILFSLTFNQTYDEILKEKETNPVKPKPARTVVKITNSKQKEQVVMKAVESNSPDNRQLVRITKSDSVVNGTISQPTLIKKQIPLISRINKSKNVVLAPSSSAARSRRVNGIVSPNSTANLEGEIADTVSLQLINDVIGIEGGTLQEGPLRFQCSPSAEDCADQRHREARQAGPKLLQRYKSSDLYKPRLQLSSKRVGSQLVTEVCSSATAIRGRKKSAAVLEETVTSPKRRR